MELNWAVCLHLTTASRNSWIVTLITNFQNEAFWSYCRLKLHRCCTVCGYFTLTVYFVLQYEHIKSRTRNTHFNQGFSLYLTFNWNISHIVNWFAVFRQDLPQPKDANSCGVFVAWYNYCNIPSFFWNVLKIILFGTSSYQHLALCVMHDNYNPTPLTQTRALRLGKYACHTSLKLNICLSCCHWTV